MNDIKICTHNERIIISFTMNMSFITIAVVLVVLSSSSIISVSSSPECYVNEDCTTSEICYNTRCINLCGVVKQMRQWPGCAYNAHCAMVAERTAGCECDDGLFGDPYHGGCEYP